MAWNPLKAFTGEVQQDAAAAQEAALREGQKQLEASYASGRGDLTNYYTQALQPYAQLQNAATGGYQAYADASGAAGLPGQIRAQQAFQTDPGYQFAQRQMEDAVQRAGNAGGISIGNRTDDIMQRTQGYANRAYGDYVSRLAPWLQQGQQTAAGMAGINTGLGSNLAQNWTGQGQAQLGTQAKIGEAQAQGIMGELTGYNNAIKLGTDMAKLAAGIAFPPAGLAMGASSLMAGGPQTAGQVGSDYAGPLNPYMRA